MKIFLVASAKGGSGRSTAAARLAEAFHAARIPSGIVDLSPYSTVSWLVREKAITVTAGRGATTPIAAEALLKPLRGRAKVVLVDTARLEGPELEAWVPVAHSLLIVSRMDAHSVSAFPAIWDSVARFRALNPSLDFAGFLPMMTTPASEQLLALAKRRFPESFLPCSIPFSEAEVQRTHESCFAGHLPIAVSTDHEQRWRALALHLSKPLGLEPVVEEGRPSANLSGMLGKLWKIAAGKLGNVKVGATA